MSSLTIGIDFITGRCVAASVSNRDVPEWPPHPGRLYMAMAAAVFETDEAPDEVNALKWLESRRCVPDIYASDSNHRSAAKYYVPTNDKITVNKSLLQSVPGTTRSKQERSFPTSIPLDSNVLYVWRDIDGVEEHIDALKRVCGKVIRVGHSSSLVNAWASSGCEVTATKSANLQRWEPVAERAELRVRVAGDGEFDRLKDACKADHIEEFAQLKQTIESTKGKPQKEAKEMFEKRFGSPYGKNLRSPDPTPATMGIWQGYRNMNSDVQRDIVQRSRFFDSDLLMLSKIEGSQVGIQDTIALTSRLRDAAMSNCPVDPPPAWLGGHDSDTGQPTSTPHTAFLALPYVSSQHADGHVMGLALALPSSHYVSPAERGRCLGPLFFNEHGDSQNIELKLGSLGVWQVRLEERSDPPRALKNETWIGPSLTWASVTPVVLDRFPRQVKESQRQLWEEEVCEIIANSCERAGLPYPAAIKIDTTSYHAGAPRAYAKSRPFRSRSSSSVSSHQRANLGDGFPWMPSRRGKPRRPQIHVFLRFSQPVQGPVLLGAGRFLGYGLCKPLRNEG